MSWQLPACHPRRPLRQFHLVEHAAGTHRPHGCDRNAVGTPRGSSASRQKSRKQAPCKESTARVEQGRRGLTGVGDAAVVVEHEDALGHVPQERGQPRLGAAEVGLGADEVAAHQRLAFDVAELHHHHGPVGQLHPDRDRLGENHPPALGAVRPFGDGHTVLDGLLQPLPAHRAAVALLLRAHVGCLERLEFFDGELEHLRRRAVGPQDVLGLRVVQQHAVAQRLHQPFVVGEGEVGHLPTLTPMPPPTA